MKRGQLLGLATHKGFGLGDVAGAWLGSSGIYFLVSAVFLRG